MRSAFSLIGGWGQHYRRNGFCVKISNLGALSSSWKGSLMGRLKIVRRHWISGTSGKKAFLLKMGQTSEKMGECQRQCCSLAGLLSGSRENIFFFLLFPITPHDPQWWRPSLKTHTIIDGLMQSTSWETLGWMKHKLESRLPWEISITSDMQMIPPYGRKGRRTKESLDESERGEWKSWLKA